MTLTARFPFAFLFIILLFACNGSNDHRVAGEVSAADSLIPPGKMALILSDIHTVEAALLNDRNEGTQLVAQHDYYQDIFRKHHVTSGIYEQSLLYYRQNPEINARIYDQVITVLAERQKQFTGKK